MLRHSVQPDRRFAEFKAWTENGLVATNLNDSFTDPAIVALVIVQLSNRAAPPAKTGRAGSICVVERQCSRLLNRLPKSGVLGIARTIMLARRTDQDAAANRSTQTGSLITRLPCRQTPCRAIGQINLRMLRQFAELRGSGDFAPQAGERKCIAHRGRMRRGGQNERPPVGRDAGRMNRQLVTRLRLLKLRHRVARPNRFKTVASRDVLAVGDLGLRGEVAQVLRIERPIERDADFLRSRRPNGRRLRQRCAFVANQVRFSRCPMAPCPNRVRRCGRQRADRLAASSSNRPSTCPGKPINWLRATYSPC